MCNFTTFEDVYQVFLRKIRDYDLAKLFDFDMEDIMFGYLVAAITKFKSCKKDITDINIEEQRFNCSLNITEIDILANFMVYEWITPYVNDEDLLKNTLNTSDYSNYSPANLLSTMKSMQEEARQTARRLMNTYSLQGVKLVDKVKNRS